MCVLFTDGRKHLTEDVIEAKNHLWATSHIGEVSITSDGWGSCRPSPGLAAVLPCSGQLVTTGGGLSPTKAVYWFRLLRLLTAG